VCIRFFPFPIPVRSFYLGSLEYSTSLFGQGMAFSYPSSPIVRNPPLLLSWPTFDFPLETALNIRCLTPLPGFYLVSFFLPEIYFLKLSIFCANPHETPNPFFSHFGLLSPSRTQSHPLLFSTFPILVPPPLPMRGQPFDESPCGTYTIRLPSFGPTFTFLPQHPLLPPTADTGQ